MSPQQCQAEALAELLRRVMSFIGENRELIDQALGGGGRQRAPTVQQISEQPQQSEPTPSADSESHQPGLPGHVSAQSAVVDPRPLIGIEDALARLTLSNGISPRSPGAIECRPSNCDIASNPLLERIEPVALALGRYVSALRALIDTRDRPRSTSSARAWDTQRMKIAAEDRGSWLCEPRVTNAIDREQLKALARRYLAGQSSVVWLCELLEQHPEIARSAVKGSLREAVTRRLQAVAIAQAGIRTELERLRNVRPGTVSCLVQTRLFLLLRSLVDHDALGIFLNRMTRDDAVERVETDSLIAEIEAERARDAQTKSRPRSDEMPNAKAVRNQRFTSVRAAFDAARAEFGIEDSGVVFSDRAAESAQDSPFLRPDDVYDALRALFSAVQGWRSSRDGAMGTTFKELLRQAGYNEKRCSESTVANYRNEYTMFVRGRVVEIGQHMTLGSGNPNTCLSIHWWRDEAMKDLIIGHCGRHLTNSLS